jgi:hypothetical protein
MNNNDYIKTLLDSDHKSRDFIVSSDIKNRFLYPFLPTIVIDNFYENPDLIRDWALSQEFFKGNRGSWPGLRTELLHSLKPELFDVLLKKLLFVLKDYGYREILDMQTGFQIIDGTWGTGWVHDDDPKLHVAGVIYMTPDAPVDSGTTIYADQPDFDGEKFSELFMKDVFSETPEERALYSKYREEQKSHFTPSIKIGNVYNRCIIFDTRNWHSADNFFGTELANSRLTQVFFIKFP